MGNRKRRTWEAVDDCVAVSFKKNTAELNAPIPPKRSQLLVKSFSYYNTVPKRFAENSSDAIQASGVGVENIQTSLPFVVQEAEKHDLEVKILENVTHCEITNKPGLNQWQPSFKGSVDGFCNEENRCDGHDLRPLKGSLVYCDETQEHDEERCQREYSADEVIVTETPSAMTSSHDSNSVISSGNKHRLGDLGHVLLEHSEPRVTRCLMTDLNKAEVNSGESTVGDWHVKQCQDSICLNVNRGTSTNSIPAEYSSEDDQLSHQYSGYEDVMPSNIVNGSLENSSLAPVSEPACLHPEYESRSLKERSYKNILQNDDTVNVQNFSQESKKGSELHRAASPFDDITDDSSQSVEGCDYPVTKSEDNGPASFSKALNGSDDRNYASANTSTSRSSPQEKGSDSWSNEIPCHEETQSQTTFDAEAVNVARNALQESFTADRVDDSGSFKKIKRSEIQALLRQPVLPSHRPATQMTVKYDHGPAVDLNLDKTTSSCFPKADAAGWNEVGAPEASQNMFEKSSSRVGALSGGTAAANVINSVCNLSASSPSEMGILEHAPTSVVGHRNLLASCGPRVGEVVNGQDSAGSRLNMPLFTSGHGNPVPLVAKVPEFERDQRLAGISMAFPLLTTGSGKPVVASSKRTTLEKVKKMTASNPPARSIWNSPVPAKLSSINTARDGGKSRANASCSTVAAEHDTALLRASKLQGSESRIVSKSGTGGLSAFSEKYEEKANGTRLTWDERPLARNVTFKRLSNIVPLDTRNEYQDNAERTVIPKFRWQQKSSSEMESSISNRRIGECDMPSDSGTEYQKDIVGFQQNDRNSNLVTPQNCFVNSGDQPQTTPRLFSGFCPHTSANITPKMSLFRVPFKKNSYSKNTVHTSAQSLSKVSARSSVRSKEKAFKRPRRIVPLSKHSVPVITNKVHIPDFVVPPILVSGKLALPSNVASTLTTQANNLPCPNLDVGPPTGKEYIFDLLRTDDPLSKCVLFRFPSHLLGDDKNIPHELLTNIRSIVPGSGDFNHGVLGVSECISWVANMFPDVGNKPATRIGSSAWVRMSYALAVWKYARLALSALQNSNKSGESIFSGAHVVRDILRRIDREWRRNKAMPLVKMVRRDASPFSHIVVLLTKVTQEQKGRAALEISDGWHVARAVTDAGLSNLILHKSKLRVGDKFHFSHASVTDSTSKPFFFGDGDELGTVAFKLSVNNVKKVSASHYFSSKLGFRARSVLYTLSTSRVARQGGTIPCIIVIVQRSYPLKYLEKICSNAPDDCENDNEDEDAARPLYVWRREEAEFMAQERFINELQNQVSERNRQSEANNVVLRENIGNACLDERARNVRRQVEFLATGINDALEDPSSCAHVSIWNPSEEIVVQMKEEGTVLFLHGVKPGAKKNQLVVEPSSVRRAPVEWQDMAKGKFRDRSITLSSQLFEGHVCRGADFDGAFVVVLVGPVSDSGCRYVFLVDSLNGSNVIGLQLTGSDSEYLPPVFCSAAKCQRRDTEKKSSGYQLVCENRSTPVVIGLRDATFNGVIQSTGIASATASIRTEFLSVRTVNRGVQRVGGRALNERRNGVQLLRDTMLTLQEQFRGTGAQMHLAGIRKAVVAVMDGSKSCI